MSTGSGLSAGHFSQPAEARARVENELLFAVLARKDVEDFLLAIGSEPPIKSKWKHREDRRDPTFSASWHVTRTKRAQRIYEVHLALRGLLTCGEIDHYASVFRERQRLKLPLRPKPTPDLTYASGSRPTPQTVARAADALAQCVRAARHGLPEDLAKTDQNALYRVLDFLKVDRRSHRPALTPAGAKKRRQRSAKAMAPIVAAERERLAAEVAAGRMERFSEYSYVNAD
jgi:hypothetical protein